MPYSLVRRCLPVAVLLLAVPVHAQGPRGAVRYVDADTPPGGDGTSWTTAFRDLQDALAVAEAGDAVWIAEGVYRPTSGSDRTATFTLRSGVALYGGFDGTETTLDERDWTSHESILSGDVGVPGDSLDNAYHVVTAPDTDSLTVLDGLTVRHGKASNPTPPYDRGGGLYAPRSDLRLRNDTFRWNVASVGGGAQVGGGVYAEGGSPLVEDVLFDQNVGGGGGLYASGGAPVLRRVVFRGNRGSSALRFEGGSGAVVEDALFEENKGSGADIRGSSPVFRRCAFRDNAVPTDGATTDGAGAFIEDGGAPRFEDCLFERLSTNDQLAGGSGGAVHVEGTAPVARPAFLRTTFRDNAANGGGAAAVHPADALFLYCHFERNRAREGAGLSAYLARVAVIGSAFVGNVAVPGTASGYGGGLSFSYAPLVGGRSVVASSLFAGNHARHGGALSLGSSGALPLDLVNVTFAGNEASETAGAAFFLNASGVRFRNVVAWGNTAPVGPEVYVLSGVGPTIERAVVAGGCPVGAACTDVADEDPLFVREPNPGPDGAWGTPDDDYGDLRLREGSPALDGGLASLLPADAWDVDGDGDTAEPLPIDVEGEPRVQGSEVDLGAYEAAASTITVSVASAGRAVSIPVGGGTLTVKVRLANHGGEAETVTLGTGGLLPNGDPYGPLSSEPVTVPAGGSVVVTLTQHVPASAPGGVYRYVAFTGSWPEPLGPSDAFAFMKVAATERAQTASGEGSWTAEVVSVAAVPEESSRLGAAVEGLAVSVSPNPSRGAATIALDLPEVGEVDVALYDVLGRRVAVLASGQYPAGRHELALDGASLPAGVYVIHAQVGDVVRAVRVTLMR